MSGLDRPTPFRPELAVAWLEAGVPYVEGRRTATPSPLTA